jgi:acyl-CoA synthetase (AMP-forming)/AMP-acid ligase II
MAAHTTLGQVLAPFAARQGGAPALVQDGVTVTYAELEARARRVAGALRSGGLVPGDRVAWLGRNSVAYFELLVGAAKAGAVTVPINWRLAPREVAELCADAAPAVIVAEPDFEATARAAAPGARLVVAGGPADGFAAWRDAAAECSDAAPASPADPALQLYTSGTTGRPKGVVLTHASLFRLRAEMADEAPEWRRWSSADTSLIAMPVSHVSGTGWALWALENGARAVVVREFDPHAVLGLIARDRITRILMVPTAIEILVNHPEARQADLSCLEWICYGGAPMPAPLLRKAMDVLRCRFVQLYGMTEAAGTVVALPPEDHLPGREARLASVGRAVPGVQLKIAGPTGEALPAGETGEVLVRGPCLMAGYFNQPEATAAALGPDGFLRTGDAGYLDPDGYLFLRDRIKDMIISGGENVYPGEVEKALREHPRVADVAVIGTPDPKWGERVTAIVVLTPGPALEAAELTAFARERIGGYKVPRRIEFVPALPRNATGKVLKRDLRAQYAPR